jgi:hypothetical protein
MRGGNQLDGRLERAEGALRDQAGDVGRHAAARMRLVDDDEPPGLLHGFQDRFRVER